MIHKEITPLLGIRQEPVFSHVTVSGARFAAVHLGHTARLAPWKSCAETFRSLYFAGKFPEWPPAICTCVEQAIKGTDEIRAEFRELEAISRQTNNLFRRSSLASHCHPEAIPTRIAEGPQPKLRSRVSVEISGANGAPLRDDSVPV